MSKEFRMYWDDEAGKYVKLESSRSISRRRKNRKGLKIRHEERRLENG